MKIISQSHQDSHAALIALVDHSIIVHEKRLVKAEAELAEVKVAIAAFEALPWYKRWFSTEPSCAWPAQDVWYNKDCLEFLKRVRGRAQYELTIELDNKESNILFRKL